MRVNRNRQGIVLLVVLGMLTLFSVLAVSYLVFTTRQRAAAFSISRVESTRVDSNRLLNEALMSVLVGSDGPTSSLWGHDLLGDLYGMRDAVAGEITLPTNYVADSLDIAPAVLLDGSFLRFPSELFRAPFNASFDRFPHRRYETARPERHYPGPADTAAPFNDQDLFPIDDEFSGRLLTFDAGPLSGLTVPIVRYFGDHQGATNGRAQLSGQIVVDLRDVRTRVVEIDGQSRSLAEWIARPSFSPHRLVYNKLVTTPTTSSTATPYGVGTFYINGRILNGTGLGWDLTRSAIAMTTGTDFNLNEVISTSLNAAEVQRGIITAGRGKPITGSMFAAPGGGTDIAVSLQGHHALYRLGRNRSAPLQEQQFLQDLPPGDTDEPYDAPDYNNLWLSYFPDSVVMGQSSPSFVRPAILNWIINQQPGALTTLTVQQLQSILYALQRSMLRPLPFKHDPPVSAALRGAGVLRLDYAEFTGSNENVGLNGPINIIDPSALPIPPSYAPYLAARITDLAQALAGRDSNGDGFVDSWDVDNNGDGHKDSIWIDAGLPLTQTADGQLVKPLVSYMIEDLGGRANANLVGNLAQARDVINTGMTGALQQPGAIQIPASVASKSPVSIMGTQFTVSGMPNGFGYGPAEIDIRAIFDATYSGAAATRFIRGPQSLIRNRTNLTTVSGVDYASAGELYDSITTTGNDLRGMLRNPTRPNLHDLAHSQGLPVDTYGRSSVGIGVDGGLLVSRASIAVANAGQAAGDSDDDPYEFRLDAAGNQPDNPYAFDDLEGVLRFDELDRDLLGSRLVEIINNYHADPAAAPDQLEALRRALAESLTTHSNSAANLVGTLPSEWRDEATVATLAATPQRHFVNILIGENPPTPPLLTPAPQLINALLWQLLPVELRTGAKIDINRPFGNGFDDDGDGVIDDQQEVDAGETFLQMQVAGTAATTRWSTTSGDPTPGEPGRNGRELFARHLYLLAMCLTREPLAGGEFLFPVPFSAQSTFTPLPAPYTQPFADEFRSMKLAQWAVNVVDFRDNDAIMTRFNYDPNPFDGWDIVNVPLSYRTVWGMENPELTLEESFAIHDRHVRDTANDDGTAAKHLMGSSGSATLGADSTPDQWRVPEGSLFLEIRSTRTNATPVIPSSETDGVANAWSYPPELYENRGTALAPNWQLDLGKLAPDNNNPVWRIAISRAHHILTPAGNPALSPDLLIQPVGSGAVAAAAAYPTPVSPDRDTLTLQPEQPYFFGSLADTTINPDRGVDRVIWFSNQNPDSNNDGLVDFVVPRDSAAPGKIFYNRSAGARYLAGGQYAIVGPRMTTYFGQLESHSTAGQTHDPADKPLVTFAEYNAIQRIDLQLGALDHWDTANMSTQPITDFGATSSATIRPILGIVAASNPPTAWLPGITTPIGVNVSEPYEIVGSNTVFTTSRAYYPAPTRPLLDTGAFPVDSWRNYTTSTGDLPDVPFDTQGYAELDRTLGPDGQKTGTRENYKTAYLQRLADPTQNFDITTNPYITVDYITIDLTVFNGSMDDSKSLNTSMGVPLWPDDKDTDPYTSPPNEQLATRYKTGQTVENDLLGGVFANLLHSANTMPPAVTNPVAAPPADLPFFPIELKVDVDANLAGANRAAHCSTLGYLNHSFGPRWSQGASGLASMTPYVGTPYNNFGAGVMWLNRPFVSPGELMWVPTTSAGTFNSRFATAEPVPVATDPYDDSNNTMPPGAPAPFGVRFDLNRQFPHLWNYLSSNANDFSKSPNFWRMLEYVATPPPYDFENGFVSPDLNVFNGMVDPAFSGSFDYTTFGPAATTTGNPNTWTALPTSDWSRAAGQWSAMGSGVTNNFWTNDMVVESLRPPFSFQPSLFRNGLINLNTIKNNQVYGALAYGFSTDAERAIVLGRSVIGAPGGVTTGGFGAFRDTFLESRRGYALGAIPIPPSGLQLRPGLDFRYPTEIAGLYETSAGADIAPILGTATDLRREPIASTTLRQGIGGVTRPLFQRDPTTVPVAGSPTRSVVHQQLGMTRLANLSSGQSNVFAVWITVGLFELNSATLSVGQEVGADTGQIKRYRSFHIIDRSVPVKYEPGQANNAKAVVQHSRIID